VGVWARKPFSQGRLCRARKGSVGAFIEDKNSGTILLQQAWRRQLLAHAIDSKLTAMGKDERAISVSGYVHRGLVKPAGRVRRKGGGRRAISDKDPQMRESCVVWWSRRGSAIRCGR
jgi:hypothetical protein